MQYKVTTMRRQMEYVHPSQHTIPGKMRRQKDYVQPRQHAIQGNEKTNRIRTSESTYNTR